ncbi:MAG TPA: YafY family protein [Pyrinomonadaceae bacterium]|nr:YafY family protein [Pyrinomonadaceae bacterium]
MRADRLLSIVLLLQARRQLTARELAAQLEVSERTIHRDMEALSAAGIPVVAERGAGGGWSLLGQYRTNLTGLSEAEARSLFVIKPTRLLADLNLEKASEGALLKLLAALPAVYREGAEYARRRIHVDVTGWTRPEEAAPLLHVLQEAVWQERRVRMTYLRGECGASERVVDPLGLVAKGSVWYLVAGVDKDVRSYRVSGVVAAELLDEPCVRPENFDLAAFWEQSSEKFRSHLGQYRTRVRVRPEIVPRLRYGGRFARVEEVSEERDADGWVRVSLRFDVEEMACEYALSFGAQLEVLEPVSLREKVSAAAQSVVDFYARRDAASEVSHQRASSAATRAQGR